VTLFALTSITDMRVRGLLAITVAATLVVPAAAVARAAINSPTPLCGAAHPAQPSTAAVPTSIRVATFNVLHGLTEAGDRTLEARLRIEVDQLAASGADIVGLQEVEESTKHGRVITRLANGLASKTHASWYWCWFRTEPHWPGAPDTYPGGGDRLSDLLAQHYNANEDKWYEGAAVLSRWPITASAVRRLPGENLRDHLTGDCKPPFEDPTCLIALLLEPRAAVWARIASPRGAISVTSAHTSGNVRQHADLMHWARQQSAGDDTALVVCDCNSTPDSAAQEEIRRRDWIDTAKRLNRDKPTSDQDITSIGPTVTDRIDYVFLRGGSALRLTGSRPFMNVPVVSTSEPTGRLWPSDHYGVIDTLE
jgi:endonuclease/exonuclease/phosphatase family metal-dependent hydrolase